MTGILAANEVKTVKMLAKVDPKKLLSVHDGPKLSEGNRSFITDLVDALALNNSAPVSNDSSSVGNQVDDALARFYGKNERSF